MQPMRSGDGGPGVVRGISQPLWHAVLPARFSAGTNGAGNGTPVPPLRSQLSDIAETGLLGCADCYGAFLKELAPSISRIHGRTAHVGKVPKSSGGNVKLKNQLSEAKRKLQDAIQAEEFEEAATLRDQIRELNERLGEGNDKQ